MKKIVIMCWFYVKNCIFEHMTDNFFPVTFAPTVPLKVNVLKLPPTTSCMTTPQQIEPMESEHK